MGRWDDLTPEADDGPVKIEIDGNFLCSICNESVDSATYHPEKSTLTWRCGTGHLSKIEDITL